jgi:hypothetical protein
MKKKILLDLTHHWKMFEAKDLETMDKDQLMKIIREQNSQLINLQVWHLTC